MISHPKRAAAILQSMFRNRRCRADGGIKKANRVAPQTLSLDNRE
jgi:hypothetical protein